MIGGWRPWERFKVARRLTHHARREGGEPPPELLQRLRDDVPDRPALVYAPAAGGRERRGISPRWLVAASLAVALAAGVIGLRVWERQLRLPEPSSSPALSAVPDSAAPDSAAPSRTQAAPPSPRLPPSRLPPPAEVAPPPPASVPAPAMAPAPGQEGGGVGLSRRSTAAPTAPTGQSEKAAGRPASPAGPTAAGGGAATSAAGSTAKPEIEMTAEQPPAATQPKALEPGQPAAATAPRGSAAPATPQARTGSGASPREAAPAPQAVAKAELNRAELNRPQPAPAPPAVADTVTVADGVTAGWPRSSFGADTGIGSYRRLRHDLLDEGRLPRAASVRAGELANAFDLAARGPVAGGPELLAEGAPLPAAGDTWLLRFDARGLRPSPGPDAVEVEFDPAMVARFHRVGATAHRGVAAALYEVELRRPAAMAAAAPRPPGERRKAAAPGPAAGPAPDQMDQGDQMAGADRIVAVLRAVSREQPGAGRIVLAERAVRLSDLRPSWDAASPALRASALAVELARALAAKDPAPRLHELRAKARALAAELPDDPKAAELLQLVQRAADLAGAPGSAAHPP
jgi:hypothetical protein